MSTNGNDTYLLERAREAGITEPRELANFMGQMQVESGGFHRMTESTRYSAPRLLEVFGPKRDRRGRWHDGRNGLTTLAEAQVITGRGPEGIANAIYGGAWGARNLGNTEPGDGWRFRGRGYVQLTGRDHYEEMGRKLGLDLVHHPELAANREIAARIAIVYWNDRVRTRGHQFDVTAATRDINGGGNGLKERVAAAADWQQRLLHTSHKRTASAKPAPASTPTRESTTHRPSSTPIPSGPVADGALTAGESGPEVRALQGTLDRLGYRDVHGRPIAYTGTFDRPTLDAVKAFQHDHGLRDRGYVGPLTQQALQRASADLVTSPTHPQHALYEQVLAGVRNAEHIRGTPTGPHSERIAAALATELVREGISRVDRVEFNRDGSLVRAVQVSPLRDEPGLNRSTDAISAPQASMRSIAESSRQLHEVAANVRAQRQDPQFAHVQAPPAPVLAR